MLDEARPPSPDHRLLQREYLLQISRAITAQLDLTSVLRLVVEVAVKMLTGTSGLIALYDEEGGNPRVRAAAGLPDETCESFAPLLSLDLERVPAATMSTVLQQVARATGLPLRQAVALPLTVGSTRVGTLYVFRAALNVDFTPNEKQLLQAFADQAAIAVSNARLYDQAVHERERLNAIIEQSADGVMILDARWRITRFNRAMEHLTGWQRDEAMGRPCAEVLSMVSSQGVNVCLHDCPLQRVPRPTTPIAEGWITTRDGRQRYIQSRYAPQYGEQGQFQGAIANVRDITEQKEEVELQNTFISVVSHELKTPVSIIKGYAGTLGREDARWEPDVLRDGLRVIEDEADRLANHIQDLLDVSRVQAGGLRLELSEWHLPDLAADVVAAFATQSSDRFQFELRFRADMPPVEADYESIRMVLTNLVSNGVKYSPDGGLIRIGGYTAQGYAVVYVADEGIGIAPDEQERIFDRFYRVDNRLRRDTQGVGLGLYLTRAVVEAHGGRIWVQSKAGQGARFVFTLPLARRRLAGAAPPTVHVLPDTRPPAPPLLPDDTA